jgi:phosphate transport system substrate-binding protein
MKTTGKLLAVAAISAIGHSTTCLPAQAVDISGAGSTFVFPILSKWASEYTAKTGNKISYQSIGSGAGVTQIKTAAVDFAASDMPMNPAELERLGLAQFPLVIGGVVPIVNIAEVEAGQLRFTGSILADIFLGKLKKWSDPAIQKLNPDVKLPGAGISVVHRADAAGTTFNWVNYLSKISTEWRDRIGEGVGVDWPTGAGGRGNEGVAALVNQSKNSIGYVEYAYVLKGRLKYGLVQNKTGQFVKPDADSFRAAASSANWAGARDFYLVITDAPGENSYPVTAATFILMYKRPKNPEHSAIALDFFKWALENGQPQASSLDYVPLPSDLIEQIERYWKAQIAADGG